MSERATAYSIPPQSTMPSVGNELAVRPKVLRRPAHFNSGRIESPVPVLVPLQQQHTQEIADKPVAVSRAWQDDGKFAITLLAIVIVVNLIVSAWLSAISPVAAKSTAQTAPVDTSPATNVHVLGSSTRAISEQ